MVWNRKRVQESLYLTMMLIWIRERSRRLPLLDLDTGLDQRKVT